jgi:hypothetical protein
MKCLPRSTIANSKLSPAGSSAVVFGGVRLLAPLYSCFLMLNNDNQQLPQCYKINHDWHLNIQSSIKDGDCLNITTVTALR